MNATIIIIKRCQTIDKAEAIGVLRELGQIHSEITFSEIVTIDKLSNANEFELKIKCVLDAHGRQSIREFLQKRKLDMRENQGFIIINEIVNKNR